MKFEINSTFKGLKIIGSEQEYLFKTKLFSHSSVLLDSRSKVVASLVRSSWWRMNFTVKAMDQDYELRQRLSGTKLISSKTKTVFHLSGEGFHRGSHLVTKITGKGLASKKYEIEIDEVDHWLALLAATCLECSPVANSE